MELKTDLSVTVVRRSWKSDNDIFLTTNPIYSGDYAMYKIEQILIPKGSVYDIIGIDGSIKDCKVIKFEKLEHPVSVNDYLLI